MRIRSVLARPAMLVTIVLAAGGCHSIPLGTRASEVAQVDARVETTRDGTSTARTLAGYKEEIARRISETNSTKVYVGQPQALLRAVVVLKYSIDATGRLLSVALVRGNHDAATESTAIASVRGSAPYPKPAASLLHNGRVEITETWLFNNDGRFQIRSIAQAQSDQ